MDSIFPSPCMFETESILDEINQNIIDLELSPPSFEEIEDKVKICVSVLDDDKTETNIVEELSIFIQSLIRNYPEQMFKILSTKFEKIRTVENFKNKDILLRCFIFSLDRIIKADSFPKEKEYLEFYDMCFNEIKNNNIKYFF